MNRLNTEERAKVVAALIEGNSIRSTVRMTGIAKNTITKLLCDLGNACAVYHDARVRNVRSRRVQCDEVWSFCYAKAKNVPEEKRLHGAGDVWTWTAIDADSKLLITWLVGKKDSECAMSLMEDLASRVYSRIQLTTDGNRVYADAVEGAFGFDVDYAMLIKLYGAPSFEMEQRYSPAQCIGIRTARLIGSPDPRHVSTSYVERHNLTMRMSMRRFTRLTNGFSKKLENHRHAIALFFMYYNFCRVHQTLRVTPAMESGLSNHVWSIEEMITTVLAFMSPAIAA